MYFPPSATHLRAVNILRSIPPVRSFDILTMSTTWSTEQERQMLVHVINCIDFNPVTAIWPGVSDKMGGAFTASAIRQVKVDAASLPMCSVVIASIWLLLDHLRLSSTLLFPIFSSSGHLSQDLHTLSSLIYYRPVCFLRPTDAHVPPTCQSSTGILKQNEPCCLPPSRKPILSSTQALGLSLLRSLVPAF